MVVADLVEQTPEAGWNGAESFFKRPKRGLRKASLEMIAKHITPVTYVKELCCVNVHTC